MEENINEISKWFEEGHKVCLAWVVNTYGSAPNKEGSLLAFRKDRVFIGSVSGGCLESAVVEEGIKLLADDHSTKVIKYGVSDQMAWEVGLACGGEITILIEKLNLKKLNLLKKAVKNHNDRLTSILFFSKLNGLDAITLQDDSISKTKLSKYFFHYHYKHRKRLLIVGGSHIAQCLTNLAFLFDFEVIIFDKRSLWGSQKRFPGLKIELDWPDQALKKYLPDKLAYLVCLSHDNKIDNPALAFAIKSKCGYIGALGSFKTKIKREKELIKDYYLTNDDIKKIHSPIGLDINAKMPNEIALSILAQIISKANSYNK